MKKLIITCCAILTAICSQAQILSINTDLVGDGFMAPNIGIEMTVGEKTTVGLNGLYTTKPYGKEIKGFALQPEMRYYVSGRPMHKEFIGVGLIGANYDVIWKEKRYDGFAYGAGITFGYVMNLTKRLNIDFHAGVGLVGYLRKEYYLGDHYDDLYREDGEIVGNSKGYYILPTRIGISVSYIIK